MFEGIKNYFRKEKTMFIVAGLGNPGSKYENTRHNAGFLVMDELANKSMITIEKRQKLSFTGEIRIDGKKTVLAKPQTFMNNSGESIRPLCDFYKIDINNELIVVYDDISLEPGSIRVRKKGSAGGHNGMKSIISHLSTQDFIRVRVGVGAKPANMDLADFVLATTRGKDAELFKEGIKNAADAVECIIKEGVDAAMNKYNKKTVRE
ncbi:peptidyl-tRNA hydrolase [Acetitomaculum ruminis DSM 5522]|uniref:Peptidyl-tRNA hydrolase n=1 Tax=Acetitomaculum ruminis DSM 5522 TaxID=1120918 RepID=A0A1I0WZP7_9FIRM|nr:aminoacyl-tRNA hydrolase [Acetitomaculum ruminis]SFA93887.1 peptidyl-tRNA hydrolase [Acetitomaculum ruminis DSM 5522]